MLKLLKLSWIDTKNIICSKEFFLGTIASFAYSLLWILFVHPTHYGLFDYDFEFGRFFYVIMLYMAVSILRNDIRFNTVKTIFTGTFSRLQIMISKGISLIMCGIVFFVMTEINNVMAALILKKIGISGFLSMNHLELFVSFVAITAAMGSLMLLIISMMFSDSKAILFIIAFLSMVNFFTAGISTFIGTHPEAAHTFSGYMKTPFYNTVVLMQGVFTMKSILINIVWAVIFYILSVIVINNREIK